MEAPLVFTCYSLTTIRREVRPNCNSLQYKVMSDRKADVAYNRLVRSITLRRA